MRFRIVLVLIVSALAVLIYRLVPSGFFTQGAKPMAGVTANSVTVADRTPFPPPAYDPLGEEISFDDFVGTKTCAECHQKQFDLWKGSTHGRAGGPPNPSTVISNFNGRGIRFKDAVVTPLRIDNEYMFVVEQQGFAKKTFKVDAVVGGGHLVGGGTQSYFSEFPDGTLRFLPFDFVRKENLWFGQIRNNRGWVPLNESLSITDLVEWPPARILGLSQGQSNCQQCHGSQIDVRFVLERQRFETRYKSLTIDCESCHGPGRRHIELAESGKMHDLADIGLRSLSTLSKDKSLGVCFQCHAMKGPLEEGYLAGKEFENFYSLKLVMDGKQYHPDGRIQSFGYQQNHLYSDCYVNGSMTCVDCHDPHSQTYRDVRGTPLAGRFDDGQCTGCHASKDASTEEHTFHKKDSPGSRCTSCHMPYLQHKGVGTTLRFARSDHTVPIPRPVVDAGLGIENACAKCHPDKTTGWLEAKTKEWYGEIKPHKPLVAGMLEVKESDDRMTVAELLLGDAGKNPMAQAAGLLYFLRNQLTPNMVNLEEDIVGKLKGLCGHHDIDAKSLALASLHLSRDQDPDIRSFLINQISLLGNEEMPVRKRWTTTLNLLAGSYRDRGDYPSAVTILKKALEVSPDDPEILLPLGITYGLQGKHDSAIRAYEAALQSAPDDPTIHLYLGITHGLKGDFKSAELAYRKALDINPRQKIALLNMGNMLYKNRNLEKAVTYFKRAVQTDPALAAGHFALARASAESGQLQDAMTSLKAGLQYDRDNVNARKMLEALQLNQANQSIR